MEEESDKQLPSSSPSVSSITTDSETETWEVIEDKEKNVDDEHPHHHKQENPKITIDKAESTYTLGEQLPSDDDETVKKDKDVCQESVSNNEGTLKAGKTSLLNR